jgi:hypothetical protein
LRFFTPHCRHPKPPNEERRIMTTQETVNIKNDNRIRAMHDWADTAVMNVKNFADCLAWQGNEEQAEFLGHFVGELIDSRDALAAQAPSFDFDIFAYAIDEPMVVFDYDWSPASFHAVVEDLIPALVAAIFPYQEPSTITKRDAWEIGVADIERMAQALSDTTGHELEDTRQRLPRLSNGLAKEYARLRSRPFIVHEGRPAKNSDTDASSPRPLPAATTNEARDKWLYKQCCDLTLTYRGIIRELTMKVKEMGWEPIVTPQGINRAANRYASRKDLSPIPPRQSGRPSSKK